MILKNDLPVWIICNWLNIWGHLYPHCITCSDFQQLVNVCSFNMKPHLHFHFSTVPETQPKVQQVEQVQILPEPGEIWQSHWTWILLCTPAVWCYCSFPSRSSLKSFCLWCACTCLLLANRKEKALPSWLSFKQANPHPQNVIWIKLFRPPCGQINLGLKSLMFHVISQLHNSVSTNHAHFAKQKVLCVPLQTHPPPPLPLAWSKWRSEWRAKSGKWDGFAFIRGSSQVITAEKMNGKPCSLAHCSFGSSSYTDKFNLSIPHQWWSNLTRYTWSKTKQNQTPKQQQQKKPKVL